VKGAATAQDGSEHSNTQAKRGGDDRQFSLLVPRGGFFPWSRIENAAAARFCLAGAGVKRFVAPCQRILCQTHDRVRAATMMIQSSTIAALACACSLVGCAAFNKAHVAAPPPTAVEPPPAAVTPEAPPKPPDEDGFRTGDLLVMPRDTEYSATHPAPSKTDTAAGTVIVTPPSAAKHKPSGKPGE